MKKIVISMVLVISLFACRAFAEVIYAYPQQVNVTYTPNALDIANSLAPVVYAMQQNAMLQQQEEQLKKAQENLDANVNTELQTLKQAAEADKIRQVDTILRQSCFSKNYTVYSNVDNNTNDVYKLSAYGYWQGTNISMEYTVDYNLAQCRVVQTIGNLQSVASPEFAWKKRPKKKTDSRKACL